MSDFLTVYLISITSLFVSYIAGKVLTGIYFPETRATAFVKLFFGFFSIGVAYSIIVAGINTGFIILLPFFFFYSLKFVRFSEVRIRFDIENVKDLAVIAAYAILYAAFVTFFYNYDNYSAFMSQRANIDKLYYIKLSEFIQINKMENYFALPQEMVSDNFRIRATPYHYIELWLNSLIATTFGILHLKSYLFVMPTIITTMLYCGILHITHYFIKKSYKSYLFAFGLIFTHGFFFLADYVPLLHTFNLQPLNNIPKYSIAYLIILAFIIGIKANNHYTVIILSVIGSMFNISFLPTFTIIAILFSTYWYVSKKISLYKFLEFIGIIMAFLISYYIYYNWSGFSDNGLEHNISETVLSFFSFKTFINIILGTILYNGVLYFLYFILFIILFVRFYSDKALLKEYYLSNVVKLILIYFISLGMWAILHPMGDSVQFFYLLGIPSLNILCILLPLLALKYTSIKQHYYIYIIIAINILYFGVYRVNKYQWTSTLKTNNFIIDNKSAFENIKNKIGVEIVADVENSKGKNLATDTYGLYLLSIGKGYNTVNITNYNWEMGKLKTFEGYRNDEMYHNSVFVAFVKHLKNKNEFTTYENAQETFIRKYKIEYAIVEKGAIIPDFVKNNTTKTITDPISQVSILLLNTANY